MGIKALPLQHAVALPDVLGVLLRDYEELACNTIVLCVTEEDRLFREDNVGRVITSLKKAGYQVWLNLWNCGGLTGGEALSASELFYLETGRERFLNAVYQLGPHADLFQNGNAITDTVEYAFRWAIDTAAAFDADALFVDEPKLEGIGRFGGHVISRATMRSICVYAAKRGVPRYFCYPIIDEDDWDAIKWTVGEGLAELIGFDRYYGAFSTNRPVPEAYIGEAIDRLVGITGSADRVLGTAQGFDLDTHTELLPATARTWRNHGVDNLLIWGGPTVNQHPFFTQTPPGYLYAQIWEAFSQ